MKDGIGRDIDYLRLSITDHCNLQCIYCMPEKCSFSRSNEFLTSDEIEKIVIATSKLGIKKVRLTGGEPLIRKDFLEILKKIKKIDGIEKIAVTTNGINLYENLEKYEKAGLNCLNISLDSLNSEKYKEITRGGDLNKVLNAIKKACEMSYERVRVNVVVIEGVNLEELFDFVNLAKEYRVGVRFIELMPIGEGKKFKSVKNSELLNRIKERYTLYEVHEKKGDGPAKYYKIDGFKGEIGFISPLSNKFCEKCNRIRVTSKGFLKLCLHYNEGIDLKPYLKKECSELSEIIKKSLEKKPKNHDMGLECSNKKIDDKRMNEIGG